ncbi:hypothetical protein ACFPOI_30280 [Nonomuraea angiospora]|uniref:Transcriptional regulator n=1 Tax=Nonomuraea angiospora TaxID=46172 RepID=A0ABR9LUN0_9ACTN|nr:hypothetical protein [Nonomuraea angiospora]MBE1584362.1 hypothetical protein [Nonomuraea angiospora]
MSSLGKYRVQDLVPSAGYHLNLLAKYGFIEDAASKRTGRERPWRACVRGVRWAAGVPEPGYAEASRMLRDALIAHALDALTAFQREEAGCTAEWQDAAFVLADGAYMTPEERRETHGVAPVR